MEGDKRSRGSVKGACTTYLRTYCLCINPQPPIYLNLYSDQIAGSTPAMLVLPKMFEWAICGGTTYIHLLVLTRGTTFMACILAHTTPPSIVYSLTYGCGKLAIF